MSNVKKVEIIARVPWNWARNLPQSEAAFFAGVFLDVISGLVLEQVEDGYEVNDRGGRIMVRVAITGQEALAWPALKRMARALKGVGELERAVARDIEAGNDEGWQQLKLDEPEHEA